MEEVVSFMNLRSKEYRGHERKVLSVAWNCTGTKLASGSVDHTARVWDIEPHGYGAAKSLKCVELKGHFGSVKDLCWDPKHTDLVATASVDKTVRIWDVRSGKCAQQVKLSGVNINIAYRPDGTHIAVSNKDEELTFLDVRKSKPIHKLKFDYQVNGIAWNTTSNIFFYITGYVSDDDDESVESSRSGTVEVLSYPSLQPLDSQMAHTEKGGCYCIAIDPCGRYFAVGSADSLVSLWDTSEMLCVRTFPNIKSALRTITFNHDGEYIACGSCESFIDISNVHTGRTVHKIPCLAPTISVKWNPKCDLLAYTVNKHNLDGNFRIFGFKSAD